MRTCERCCVASACGLWKAGVSADLYTNGKMSVTDCGYRNIVSVIFDESAQTPIRKAVGVFLKIYFGKICEFVD